VVDIRRLGLKFCWSNDKPFPHRHFGEFCIDCPIYFISRRGFGDEEKMGAVRR